MKKLTIRWICPHCQHKHEWKWTKEDMPVLTYAPAGDTWMKCEECKRESCMSARAPDDWRWNGDWRRG